MNKMRNEEHRRYDRMVKALPPNSNYIQGYLRAFWVGGVICTIGQLISLWGEKGLGLSESSAAMLTSVILIFLGTTLTGIGVYDDIGHYAGAGSIVPITGFANSIAAPAILACARSMSPSFSTRMTEVSFFSLSCIGFTAVISNSNEPDLLSASSSLVLKMTSF